MARRHRVTSLLGQRRVIDDKKARLIANQVICLLQQGSLEWSTVPNSGSDEMMELIVADLASARRYRLNALAISCVQGGDKLGHWSAVMLAVRAE